MMFSKQGFTATNLEEKKNDGLGAHLRYTVTYRDSRPRTDSAIEKWYLGGEGGEGGGKESKAMGLSAPLASSAVGRRSGGRERLPLAQTRHRFTVLLLLQSDLLVFRQIAR